MGYFYPRKLKSATKNKPSAYQHPAVVDSYAANVVSLGRVASPFANAPIPGLHVSSFGVIPKKGQPGKWRFIVDLSSLSSLSSLRGSSVSGGISANEFTMHDIHVDQIIRMVSRYRRGALMAKFDVEGAYRNISVDPSDRFLLGVRLA